MAPANGSAKGTTARAGAGAQQHQQQQPRRASRIVPAIPYKLMKPKPPATPVTPPDTEAAPPQPQQPDASSPAPEAAAPEATAPQVDGPSTPQSPVPTANVEAEATASPVQPSPQMNSEHAQTNGTAPVLPPHPTQPPAAREQESNPVSFTVQPDHTPAQSASAHHARPSVENIVFGNMTDSADLPSTSREHRPETYALPQAPTRDPPGFGGQPSGPPAHPGHSHTSSDAQPMWTDHSGHVPVYPLPNGHLSPHHASVDLPPHSQSPLKSQASSEHGWDSHRVMRVNGSVPPVPVSKSQEFETANLLDLARYLGAQMTSPDFSDCRLVVSSAGRDLWSGSVSTLIVARSPAVSSAIEQLGGPSKDHREKTYVDLACPDKLAKFITREAIDEAIKVLYGAPLVHVDGFVYGLRPYDAGDRGAGSDEARHKMSQAISYAAAAAFFGLNFMLERGMLLIRALLRWDTFDQALAYALATTEYAYPDTALTSQAPPEPRYGPSSLLVRTILDFLVFGFPASFSMDPLAPELTDVPRLPLLGVNGQQLSNLRFGDSSQGNPLNSAASINRLLSSVILSLPLYFLNVLFNHPVMVNRLGWDRLRRAIEEATEIREDRRLMAKHEHDSLGRQQRTFEMDRVPPNVWQYLYWEERVVPSATPSGYTVLGTHSVDDV